MFSRLTQTMPNADRFPMSLQLRVRSPFTLNSTVLFLLLTLGGCAAQMAFKDGKDLVRQDKVEQGLAKMQEASQRDPHEIEYKTTYFQTRDTSIAAYLEQADRYFAAGRRQDAEDLFHRVLAMDTGNVRARDGLHRIDMEARHKKLLQEAERQFGTDDIEPAKQAVGVVLTENPSNEQALQLQKAIIEKTSKPVAANQLAAIYKKTITLQFKDVSLKQVFELISRSSGLNFLFDKDVKTDQKTSIFLKDSTIEAAVYYTLLTNQLEQQVMDGNTVLIYPNTLAKQKDYQEMIVKSFFLTNADAKTVAATLKSIIKARDVVVDEKLNMLIMRDSPDAIKLAEKLIALHDVAEPEVMLEVEILEVKRTKLQDLGIRWPDSMSLTPLSTLTTGGLVLSDLNHLNAGNIGVTNPTAVINAHNNDTDANLLANPRIRARNHEKAKIMIGDKVPNITVNTAPTSTGFISETINYVDVGLKLEVEPTVFLDNDVAIKIALEVSNIVSQLQTKSGSIAYQIGTRNASTVLRLKDGETQVLAGLINDEDRRTGNKIPAIGDLPVLGRLFGSTNDNKQKTEIILSITPHLIRNIQRPDATAAQFKAGTETSFKPRPESGDRTSINTLPSASAGNANVKANINSVDSNPTPADPATGNRSPNGRRGPSNSPYAIGNAASAVAAPVEPTSIDPQAVASPQENGLNPSLDVPPPSATGALQLNWRGPAMSRVGSNFVLQINAQTDSPLSSLPVTVGFDNAVFQVLKVSEGNFFSQDGAQSNFSSQIDAGGQVLINGTTSGGGNSASGVLASITFRSIAPSTGSAIQILSASPIGASGRAVDVTLNNSQTVRVQP